MRVLWKLPAVLSTISRIGALGLLILFTALSSVWTHTLDDFNEYELDCPEVGDQFIQPAQSVLWGAPDRALRTMPADFYIAPSHIPDAGLGIYSDKFIARFTWLGEYEGEIIPPDKQEHISWYTWTVHRDGEVAHFVDGGNVETSTFLRFFNSPIRQQDENVQVCECMGRIYYMTVKDVAPGTELLVFYGEEYLTALGIDMKGYYETDIT